MPRAKVGQSIFVLNSEEDDIAYFKVEISRKNMSEKCCLKQNDFHSNASKSFGALRSE